MSITEKNTDTNISIIPYTYIIIVILVILICVFIFLYIKERNKSLTQTPSCPVCPSSTSSPSSSSPSSSITHTSEEIKLKNSKYNDLNHFLTKINEVVFDKELIVFSGSSGTLDVHFFPDESTRNKLENISDILINALGISIPDCVKINGNFNIYRKLYYMITYSYVHSIITKDPEKISMFILYVIFVSYFKFFKIVQRGNNRLFRYNSTERYIEIIKENINTELYDHEKDLKVIDNILQKNKKMYIYEIVDKIKEKIGGKDIKDNLNEQIGNVLDICLVINRINENGLTQMDLGPSDTPQIFPIEKKIKEIIINMYLIPLIETYLVQ
jgi:hypothetical protein